MNLRVIAKALRFANRKKQTSKRFERELIKIFATKSNYEDYFVAITDERGKRERRLKWEFKDPGNLNTCTIKSALKIAMGEFHVKSYTYGMFEKQLLQLCDGRNNMARYLGYSSYNKYVEYCETINNVSKLKL